MSKEIGCSIGTKDTDLRTELWLMNSDGTNKTRLTYFNEKGHPEYMGHAIVGDNCWLPDGRTVVLSSMFAHSLRASTS